MHSAEVLAHLRSLVLVIDNWGTIVRADGARDGFLGHDVGTFPGRNSLDFVASEDHEHVATVFAGGGDWILSSSPTPFPLRIVAADGSVETAECLATRAGDGQWVLTLTPSALQFSTYHALDLYLGGAGPLEVATGVARRASQLWPEGVVTEAFVLHANGGGVLTQVVAGDHETEMGAAMEECVADPDAPWNSTSATRHGPIEPATLPPVLAEAADRLGYGFCELGIVAIEGAVVIATISFGTDESAFAGSTRVILGKAIEMIEAAARRAHVENILRVAAETDHLTGLLNRAAFEHALAENDDSESCVSVLFIDIDQFKNVNDTYGHAIGDAVLVEVGRRISASCRPTDVVARLGGDEFAVLLPGVDEEVAERVGRRIIERIATPLPPEFQLERVTASLGAASGCSGLVELVDSADQAMLTGKRSGGATMTTATDQPPIAR